MRITLTDVVNLDAGDAPKVTASFESTKTRVLVNKTRVLVKDGNTRLVFYSESQAKIRNLARQIIAAVDELGPGLGDGKSACTHDECAWERENDEPCRHLFDERDPV